MGGIIILNLKKYNTKALYFSDKLKESLKNIFDYPLTILEAPMGYGKTTAVKSQLNNADANLLWQTIYEDSPSIFWNGLCKLFSELDDCYSQSLVQLGVPNDSVLLKEALNIIGNINFPNKTVYVIDDYHLLHNQEIDKFIEFLVRNEIENFHIVIIGRFTEFQSLEELKLKGYLHYITQEAFEFEPKEIIRYYKLCGINIKDEEAKKLHSFTEGWISALYLIMLNFISEGDYTSSVSIYNLVEKAIYKPFSHEIKEFLLTMCIFDRFTLEQAFYMWQKENIDNLLTEIINKNAFIKYDIKTKSYQMHSIFTNFLKDVLDKKDIKNNLYKRAGQWCWKNSDYFAAMHYFYICKDFESLLVALEEDKANSISSEYKEVLIKYMEECPSDIKKKHHFALLVYAMALFTFNEIELFNKACTEFMVNIEMDESLNSGLKNRLLGEYELIISFTEYNDINKMAQHHKEACKLLCEPSAILDTESNWTFGSPSVLYMFYRETGKLEKHVNDMAEALPCYQQLTNGHGNGSEYVMKAEWYFNIGDFENAEITIHKALYKAQLNMEMGIIICAMFLQIRIALIKSEFSHVLQFLEKMREIIKNEREYFFIHTIDMCESYVYSLLKQKDKVPKWIEKGDFNSRHLLFPTISMLNILYGRALLINKEYLKLIGSSEHFIGIASVFPNLLGYIYTHIYAAAANKQIYRDEDALSSLKQALDIAMPDKMYMPFVENCDYIKSLLEKLYGDIRYQHDIAIILNIYNIYQKAKEKIIDEHFTVKKIKLTEREKEIAFLVADGLTNKEIGKKLFISPNTVKTQLKSIFEKLGVNSRSLLKQYLDKEN